MKWPGRYYVYGAHAQNNNSEGKSSQITVTGGIRTLIGNPCDYALGAFAGQDATVTVGGDIFLEGKYVIGLSSGSLNDGNGTVTAQNVTVMGEGAIGVSAAGESTATVNGAVTATGVSAVGVSAELSESGSGGTVLVEGDVAVTGNASTGVACLSSTSVTAKSTVTVDGTVSGQDYLKIDNTVRAKDTKNSVTGGYWIYTGQYESEVKVKDPDGGTPGGNAPTAPQNFTAAPGSGLVVLSWTAPTSTGDSAVIGYQVSKDGGTSWTNVGLTTSYMFMNLTNGTEYTFKVRAVNSAGSGAEASRTATPTSASSVPTAPRNFTASPGFERVILDWDAPMSNGGSGILRYEVSKNNGADWTSAGLYTRYEFTGLTNGTEYTFKVRAVNAVGPGEAASAQGIPRSTGGSVGGGGSNNHSSIITPPATTEWLERSGTSASIAAARESGLRHVLTRANSQYGVRGAAWAALSGYQYWHDTMGGSAVQVRVYVKNPTAITTDLLVSGTVKGAEVQATTTLFEKFFSNTVRTIHMDQTGAWGQSVEIAAKVDLTGMDVTRLMIYSYDKTTNAYRRIEKPAYWVDTNGYLHFTTQYAGDIVISEGPLTRIETEGAK